MENSIEEYSNDDRFTVTPDMMDAIRMEFSTVSPEENKEVEELSQTIKEKILAEYGNHISFEIKERLEKQQERVLIVDHESMSTFTQEWLPSMRDYPLKEDAGYYMRIGNLVLIYDIREKVRKEFDEHPELYSHLLPEHKKLIEDYAKRKAFVETITHELIHSCQQGPEEKTPEDTLKHLAFDECGATYISNKMMKNNYPEVDPSKDLVHEFRNRMFSQLLQLYGDGVYDVLFDNVPEEENAKIKYEELKNKIFTDFQSTYVVSLALGGNVFKK